ncbi:MAG: UMP kinase [Thermodesulfobacteriota bacterium]
MAGNKYKRILLKLSGEALMGDTGYGINKDMLKYLADELAEVKQLDLEMGIVVGAGNIFRGLAGASSGMDRAEADNMGMLATIINSIALKDTLNRNNIPALVLSAIRMEKVCKTFSRKTALEHLVKGDTVIFGGGTGNPYFTTDTAALLRGLEIDADLICKATRVDGVYDQDPLKNSDAFKYDVLTYNEALEKQLNVMDATAISLAMDNNKLIRVFNIGTAGNLKKVVCGENIGTLIKAED